MAQCCTDVFEGPVSTFLNTRMWHVGVLGFYGYGENRVTFDGWVHYNDPAQLVSPHENPKSFYFGDYLARNIIIRQADIQGLRIGVMAPIKAGDTGDIYGNTPGTLLVENSTLKNFWNIYTNTPYGVTGGGTAIPPRVVIARNVQFSNVPGTSVNQGQAHVFRHFTPDRWRQSEHHRLGPGRRRSLQRQRGRQLRGLRDRSRRRPSSSRRRRSRRRWPA